MDNISKPVIRKDHKSKITGNEKYVGDFQCACDGGEILSGRLLRTEKAHAEIISVTVPQLPENYFYIDGRDAPRNVSYYPLNDTEALLTEEEAERIKNSMPLFADKVSEYAGQPVGMIAGPDKTIVRELVKACSIEYRELPAVIGLKDAKEVLARYERTLGKYESAFLSADFIYEETFSTGRQYQAYMETQSIMAEPESDGRILIHGSMQCPFTVRNSVAYTLGCDAEQIHIRQDAIGGAFGGKEDFPSFIAPQAAVAARKTGKAVRLSFDRSEDLQFNYKRHPSLTHVRAAVKNGKVTALDIDAKLDAGAFLVSSGDVAMRFFTTFPGVYSIPNLHVTVNVMKTNTPPNGAFRGFGGPQCEFSMDMVMAHIADELQTDDLEFRAMHMAAKGKCTATGGEYQFEVPLPRMIEMAQTSTAYSEKRMNYFSMRSGRLKSGIGIAFANHGCPLGGDIEWELVKPKVRIRKHADNTVDLFTSQTELGQGVRTAFCKIAAKALGIPYDQVNSFYPDSDETSDTGVTAASRSIVCVGKTVEDAALKLKKIWKDGEEQEVTAQYEKPENAADFDLSTMTGTQYNDYSWSVVVVEVLVDILTGNVKITNAHGIYSVGTPIDENILTGQMEGGLLQGLGFSAMERMVIGKNGKMFNTSFADYHIPTATDIPSLSVEFERSDYPGGPAGAKGAGELPLVGVAAAYVRAVEQALGKVKPVKISHVPFVAEDVLNLLDGRH